jgi:hypothetical protein
MWFDLTDVITVADFEYDDVAEVYKVARTYPAADGYDKDFIPLFAGGNLMLKQLSEKAAQRSPQGFRGRLNMYQAVINDVGSNKKKKKKKGKKKFPSYRANLGVVLNSVAETAWSLTTDCNITEQGGADLMSDSRPADWPTRVASYFQSAVNRGSWHAELKSTWGEGAEFDRREFCSMSMLLALGIVEAEEEEEEDVEAIP